MLILSVRDNENNRCKRKVKKDKDRKVQRGDAGYSESVGVKWFYCAIEFSSWYVKLL